MFSFFQLLKDNLNITSVLFPPEVPDAFNLAALPDFLLVQVLEKMERVALQRCLTSERWVSRMIQDNPGKIKFAVDWKNLYFSNNTLSLQPGATSDSKSLPDHVLKMVRFRGTLRVASVPEQNAERVIWICNQLDCRDICFDLMDEAVIHSILNEIRPEMITIGSYSLAAGKQQAHFTRATGFRSARVVNIRCSSAVDLPCLTDKQFLILHNIKSGRGGLDSLLLDIHTGRVPPPQAIFTKLNWKFLPSRLLDSVPYNVLMENSDDGLYYIPLPGGKVLGVGRSRGSELWMKSFDSVTNLQDHFVQFGYCLQPPYYNTVLSSY